MKMIPKHLRRVLPSGWHKILQDPRQRRGSWRFGQIMDCVMNGMLSGCRNLRKLELLTSLSGERIPDTTIWDLLVQVDPSPLDHKIARGVKEAARSHELDVKELPLNLVAIDGKSIAVSSRPMNERSVNRSQGGAPKYVNFMLRAMHVSSALKLHLGQLEVPKGTNEQGAFPLFLDKLLKLYGRTNLLEAISLDTGYVSKKNAHYMTEKGVFYIMVLKNKRSRNITREAISSLDLTRKPDVVESEQAKGKTITRSLFRCEAPVVDGWESATEVWRVDTQTKSSSGKKTEETRYFVTSIPPNRLSHKNVLHAVRLHWGIENNAHWILDTAWKEDLSPWCNNAMSLISLLRLLAYNVVARLKYRRFRSPRNKALTWKDLLLIIERLLFPLNSKGHFATL